MDGSTLMMFVRLIFSLAVVIGLMWAAATVLRKRGIVSGSARRGSGADIELVARRSMGRNSSIVVIKIGERSMVVGVTDHQITKLDDAELTEIDLSDAGSNWTAPAGTTSLGSAWKTMLEQMRTRTTRR
jgi:flagellar biosynthetic protein FliO